MELMSGGEAVAKTLAALGVKHVFGIVSVHNLPIYEAITRLSSTGELAGARSDGAQSDGARSDGARSDGARSDGAQPGGIKIVNVRHEQAAAHAADAYFRATGELGVLLASTGPGTANAVPGIYEAAFASSRVLLVTGQTESLYYGKGKGFIHENERQVPLLRSVCRMVATVRHTEEIPADIMRVAYDICSGRPQPGAIEIPIDLQYKNTSIHIPAWEPPARVAPDPATLDAAAQSLLSASRPIIWAGGGVNIAGAAAELTELAERLGACVVTSIEGRGAIPEDHELSLGFCSDRRAMDEVFEEADLLLAVGTRFQNYATRIWNLPLPSELIHMDVDPSVIGLNYRASQPIVADAKLGLQGLLDRLPSSSASAKSGSSAKSAADPGFADRARKCRATSDEQLRSEIGQDHSAICDIIRRLLPPDAMVVRDSTVPVYMWGNRLLPILRSRTSIRPAAVAIGPGVPLGIGAAVGAGTPTVVLQGDGGLLLSVGELSSCVEHNLGVIVLVFNDVGYGVLRVIQDAVFGDHHGTDLSRTDFVTVASGLGMAAEAVSGVPEFEAAFERAVERAQVAQGPTLLDIDMAALAPITFPLPAHQRRQDD